MNAMRVSSLSAVAQSPVQPDGFTALDTFHRKVLGMLDELSRLVAKVEVSGLDPQVCASAARIAGFFESAPREHHEDEERHVFPALVRSGDPVVVEAVLRLQQDHDWLEEDWFEIGPHVEAIGSGFLSYDIDVLREGVAAFAALYHDHIELEETYIYPEARLRIGEPEQRAMGREIAARRRASRAARARHQSDESARSP
jgi:hemerythrin-like domain-containing protein